MEKTILAKFVGLKTPNHVIMKTQNQKHGLVLCLRIPLWMKIIIHQQSRLSIHLYIVLTVERIFKLNNHVPEMLWKIIILTNMENVGVDMFYPVPTNTQLKRQLAKYKHTAISMMNSISVFITWWRKPSVQIVAC